MLEETKKPPLKNSGLKKTNWFIVKVNYESHFKIQIIMLTQY